MDARAIPQSAALLTERSDRSYLILLLLLLIPLRGWLLYNTEVAARDSVGYIRYALHFEQMSFSETLRAHEQHPGYAVCIWLVSLPLRALHGGVDPDIMRVAAQTVSALASLLLIFPMFYFGKAFLGARVAFWGALCFQVLPVSGHHLSDGVSEPLFLLLTTTALWQAAIGLQTASDGSDHARTANRALFLSGVFGGLAYLTRPEGALVVLATGLVLLTRQIVPRWRLGWRRFVAGGLCVALPAVAAAGLYFVATGALTRKNSPRIMIGTETLVDADDAGAGGPRAAAPTREAGLGTGRNALFAAFIPRSSDLTTQAGRAVWALANETVQALHYLGVIGVVLGFWWFGGHLMRQPGFWVIAVFTSLQLSALLVLAMRVFYVSDRHVMVPALPGCYLLAAGLLELGWRIRSALGNSRWADRLVRWRVMPLLAVGLLVGLTLMCMPKTLERVHRNRAGNHLAGLWLKEHLKDGDLVVDDHCWSHYYAGQVFQEGREPLVAPDYRPLTYVVMTRSNIKEVDEGRKQQEAELRAQNAAVVFQWPGEARVEKARVVIYALPRDWQRTPWRVASIK